MDRRRSQRVHAQLPMIVRGKSADESTFADPTRAMILSAHGCLTTLSAPVKLGERVVVRNIATGEEQDCHTKRSSLDLYIQTYLPLVYCFSPVRL